jgi:hypothetical protein
MRETDAKPRAESSSPFFGAKRRAGDSEGSRRFLGLPLRTEIRIPAPEGILPLFVEHPSSYLQEKMCSTLAPSHLLFLHHPFAHDLIDGVWIVDNCRPRSKSIEKNAGFDDPLLQGANH